jgi:hypothetical protein
MVRVDSQVRLRAFHQSNRALEVLLPSCRQEGRTYYPRACTEPDATASGSGNQKVRLVMRPGLEVDVNNVRPVQDLNDEDRNCDTVNHL